MAALEELVKETKMTVHAPMEKLSWKFSIPVVLALLGLVVAVWLLPLPVELLYLPPLTVTRIVCTAIVLFITFAVLCWTFWGDVE